MPADYTTPDKVASLLGLDSFSATTAVPTGLNTKAGTTEVTNFIEWAQDEIDRITGHTWRSTLVENRYFDLLSGGFGRRNVGRHYGYYVLGVPIRLKHRKIRTFVSGTHKIEVWNGSEYDDLVSGSFTEDRNGDYWIDFEKGVIYIINPRPIRRRNAVRVTYAYGDSTVPGDIEKATTMLAAIQLLENDDYSNLFPEGTENIQLRSKAEMFEKKVDKILSRRTDLKWV